MSALLIVIAEGFAWSVGIVALLLAIGWIWELWSEARHRTAPPGRMVDVGGRRLHLLEKGDAPGPTVVIEQGAGELSIYWWPIQDAVAGFARVCTYDRAGYGWSDVAKGPRSMAERVADLHRVLHAGGVPGPYVLVGHSYGGPMISLFARDYPDETAGLVFADTPDMENLLGPAYQSVTRKVHLPMVRVLGFMVRFGVTRLLGIVAPKLTIIPDSLPEACRRAAVAVRRSAASEAAADDMTSLWSIAPADGRPLAAGDLGDKPVGVISHSQPFPGPFAPLEDGFPQSQQRLMALSANSLQVTPPDAGHMVQIDAPEAVVDVIRRVYESARDGTSMTPRAPALRSVA